MEDKERLIRKIIDFLTGKNKTIAKLVESIKEKSDEEATELFQVCLNVKNCSYELFDKPYLKIKGLAFGVVDADNKRYFEAYFTKSKITLESTIAHLKNLKISNEEIVSQLNRLKNQLGRYKNLEEFYNHLVGQRKELDVSAEDAIKNCFKLAEIMENANASGNNFKYSKLLDELEEAQDGFRILIKGLDSIYSLSIHNQNLQSNFFKMLEQIVKSDKLVYSQADVAAFYDWSLWLKQAYAKKLELTRVALLFAVTVAGVEGCALPNPKFEPMQPPAKVQPYKPASLYQVTPVIGRQSLPIKTLRYSQRHFINIGEKFNLELKGILEKYQELKGNKEFEFYTEAAYFDNVNTQEVKELNGITYFKIEGNSMVIKKTEMFNESSKSLEVRVLVVTKKYGQENYYTINIPIIIQHRIKPLQHDIKYNKGDKFV